MYRCMLGNKRFDFTEVYDKPYKDTGRQTRHLNDLVLGLLIYREELSGKKPNPSEEAVEMRPLISLPYIAFLFILDFNPVLHF